MYSYDETEYHPSDEERRQAVAVLRLGSDSTVEVEEELRAAMAELRRQDEVVERVLAGLTSWEKVS